MQKYNLPAILAISAVLVGSGIFATTGILGPQNQATTEGTNVGGSLGFTGHVILEAKDSQGQITAYRQTDNLIVNGGANCIGKLVFLAGGANATNPLSGCATYHWLVVGTNSSGFAPAVTDSDYANRLVELTNTNRVDGNTVNLGVTNSTGGGAAAAAVASIGNTITIGSTGGTVTYVGLADTNTFGAGHVFSKVKLGSSISVNPSDTIKVTWYISITH
ncbi:MAG: hypothetical protein AUH84_07290 [Thaumarchaeota archaeon 13_1_40CM_4_38_7]|nr:MAG: hypothetical protein AUH84_07290 [Thaumarchaeota archaeon 13_1_40CM_4_38_7]OLC93462.1 MAG: hypothetical protein AUI92_02780 [Thaumarchaeota archaeon 13_1_40CM_3_38_6]